MNYGYCDIDDLIQVGLMGLYQASLNYDCNRHVAFSTYATYYIIGEIKKEYRNSQKIKLSREIYRILRKMKNVSANYSLDELSKALEVSKDNLLVALLYQEKIVSLDKSEDQLINLVPDKAENISYDLMHDLDKPMQDVITLKYYKGYTQKEIGRILKLSQSKISRIEASALSILRKSR
jgi:RNA polymerase sigma factor (sigma-70 family)